MRTKGAVEVIVHDPAVSDCAQRIVYLMRAQGWQGDVEMVSLLQQLLEGCGAEFPKSEYEWDPEPPLILLEGLEKGNRFFSTNSKDKDPRYLITGKLAYKIIGYAETSKEAQIKLYGWSHL